MQKGKFNVLVDLQYGSTGKAKVAGFLADKFRPEHISSTNMPNAGHTIVIGDKDFVGKALPSPAFFNKVSDIYNPDIWLGSSAAFTIGRLLEEIQECNLVEYKLHIHPRAGVVTQEHAEKERTMGDGPKHIASTMQGCGAMLADKVMRNRNFKLATNYDELKPYIMENMSLELIKHFNYGETFLHEGAQGFSLDIHHGQSYPTCTSRQTIAQQMIADMGVPIRMVGDVYGVFRSFPIRVGNVIENGSEVGHSGGCYVDQVETSWEEVARRCGGPLDFIMETEITTVTKRQRRVFEFSLEQLKTACAINGVTKLVFNFANYLDWDCYKARGGIDRFNDMSTKVKNFVHDIEMEIGIPVVYIGTGPDLYDMISREAGEINSANINQV